MLVLSVPLSITGARAELRQGIPLEKSPREEDMGGDYSGKKKEREGRQKEGGKEKER